MIDLAPFLSFFLSISRSLFCIDWCVKIPIYRKNLSTVHVTYQHI
jgi:hypothetical protein